MQELRKRLFSALTDFCSSHGAKPDDYEIRLGTTRLGRVFGVLIWNRYDGTEISGRQTELWDYLFKVLTPDELRYISYVRTCGVSETVFDEEFAAQAAMPLPWE